jgi:heme oxygenase
MWRHFVAVLNEVGKAPGAARLIETSALATFAAFEKRLAEGRMRGSERPAF